MKVTECELPERRTPGGKKWVAVLEQVKPGKCVHVETDIAVFHASTAIRACIKVNRPRFNDRHPQVIDGNLYITRDPE